MQPGFSFFLPYELIRDKVKATAALRAAAALESVR